MTGGFHRGIQSCRSLPLSAAVMAVLAFTAVLIATKAIAGTAQSPQLQGMTIFELALVQGSAIGPVPADDMLASSMRALQHKTGAPGPFAIKAVRKLRFKQQPSCGRIAFMVISTGTNTGWPQTGGELNICDNGAPPKRVCASAPNVLLPLSLRRCGDGSEPVDAPEVAAVIQDALTHGGLSREQVRKTLGSAP